jgi:hypothetical protein
MPRRNRPLARAIAAAGLALLLARLAGADDSRARAREHYDRAVQLLKTNELDKALEELKTAYALHPHHAVLYNLGMTYAALGKPLESSDHLERYLREGGTAIPEARRVETERTIEEQTRKLGRLQLGIEPKGARVFVDGVLRGTAPLGGVIRALPGKRTIRVELEGHRTETRTVEVSGGQLDVIPIALAKLEPGFAGLAPLEIDCSLQDVEVLVDGRPVGSSPLGSLFVPLGAHEVELRRPGYIASKHSVLVARGSRATVRCNPRLLTGPARRSFAKLELVTSVSPDETLVDGQPLPPDGRIPAGKHRIEIKAAGYRPWAGEVTLEPGETRELRVRPEPTAELLSTAKTQRTWAWALGTQGLVLVAAAGAFYVWNDARYNTWKQRQEDLDAEWKAPPPNLTPIIRRQTQNDELIESVHQFDNVSLGLVVVGGVSLGASAFLFLTGQSPSDLTGPDLALSIGGGRAGWRFAW